jgi:hypothetical protein
VALLRPDQAKWRINIDFIILSEHRHGIRVRSLRGIVELSDEITI